MLAELNERLAALRARLEERDRVRKRVARQQEAVASLDRYLEELAKRLAEEEKDVARLEGSGWTSFVAGLLGNKEEKLTQERQELLEVTLRHDSTRDELEDARDELERLEIQQRELADTDERYAQALAEKAALLAEHGHPAHEKLFLLADERGRLRDELVEVEEALRAGKDARSALLSCTGSLSKAKNWGVVDMIGGGLVTTAIKHSHINRARDASHQARRAMSRFRREMKDLERHVDANVRVGDFATFADYLFDGFFVDWFLQSRIEDAHRNVASNVRHVETALRKLEPHESALRERLAEIEEASKRLLESAE